EPYHTSIRTGNMWMQELLTGHRDRMRRSIGMRKHVFDRTTQPKRSMNRGAQFLVRASSVRILIHYLVDQTRLICTRKRFCVAIPYRTLSRFSHNATNRHTLSHLHHISVRKIREWIREKMSLFICSVQILN
ncbi:hypothetical protein C8R47DRAFT_997101, partial [Mycena vitilis]